MLFNYFKLKGCRIYGFIFLLFIQMIRMSFLSPCPHCSFVFPHTSNLSGCVASGRLCYSSVSLHHTGSASSLSLHSVSKVSALLWDLGLCCN